MDTILLANQWKESLGFLSSKLHDGQFKTGESPINEYKRGLRQTCFKSIP